MLTLTLVGHLGKDATINETAGKKVINFSVAHSEKYKDGNGTPVTKTTWVECAKWGDSTAIAAYLKKGTQVAVLGRPEVQLYKKQDGTSGVSFRCHVTSIELLGSKKESDTSATNTQAPEVPAANPENADDLPF